MSTETTKKKIKIDNGTEFARVYTDKEVDSKLTNKQDTLVSGTNIKTLNGQSILGSGDLPVSGGSSSDTATITLTPEQAQSLSQFQITFTQEQATLLEKATSFKFYYAGNEIAHGQCGKIIHGSNIFYGLTMILANTLYSGTNKNINALTTYTELIELNPYIIPNSYLDLVAIEKETFNNFLFEMIQSDGSRIEDRFYFSNINGEPIISNYKNEVKNYDLGKSINLFGNHSILVPNSSTDTEINLYNHFIKITSTKDTTQVIARFTIQSSNNLVVDTPEKLVTLLGNEFELGCNGIYGNYNITGLKKTADGALNIIYNNGGAESLLNTTVITLTIEDNVKNI